MKKAVLCTLVLFLFLVTGVFAAEPVKMKIGLSNEPGSPRVKAESSSEAHRQAPAARSR
jgi:hypothetical protein